MIHNGNGNIIPLIAMPHRFEKHLKQLASNAHFIVPNALTQGVNQSVANVIR